MNLIKRVFDFKGGPILAAAFLVLFVAETRTPLRKRKQNRLQRIKINSIVAIPGFTLLRLLFLPVMVMLARKNQQLKAGLYYHYPAHPILKTTISVLLLDYSNYIWHILLHKIPMLWRMHLVHHSDHDLDITTALRFHFGEMIGSVLYRGACVFITGASPMTVLVYEIAFESATQFHHSNLKLPVKVERIINSLIVTPRMHGIHHSVVREQTDSNYSVIFSLWDRISNTIRLNVPQQDITIGVPQYNNADELSIGYLLKLPFMKVPAWPQQIQTDHSAKSSFLQRNILAE